MISNAIKLQPTFESCGLITHLTRYILHCNLIHMLQLPATPQISAKCQLLQKTKTTSCIILELFLPKIKYTKEWTDLQARTTTNRLQILFAAPRRLMAICHALQIKLVMDGWMDDMDEGRMDQLRMYTSYIYICIHIRKNMTKTMPKSKSHEFGASTYDPMTSAKTLRCGDAGGHALELLQRTERCAPNDCSSMGGTQRTTPTATPLPVQNSIITIIINYI